MSEPTAPVSRVGSLVCPLCEAGELAFRTCNRCYWRVEEESRRALQQIILLPDAFGEHACECGHPEMRRLPPDGVFWCPACGSEVEPADPA